MYLNYPVIPYPNRILNVKNIIIFFISLLPFCSCSRYEAYNSSILSSDLISGLKVETKSSSNEDYRVSEKDIDSYIRYKELSLDKNIIVQSIVPLDNSAAFVINYDTGWEIISGDKRVPPVLAESSEGFFDYDQCPEPIKEWLSPSLSQISLLQSLPDSYDEGQINYENITKNVDFWRAISADNAFVQEKYLETLTKSGDDEIIIDPNLPGHWELVDIHYNYIDYTYNVSYYIPHWQQSAPYNAYSPFLSALDTTRALAGCGAVAGAGLLFQLNREIGIPNTAPTEGYVSGYVGGIVTQSFTNYTSTAWNQMEYNNNLAALLIGSIGNAVNMNYTSSGSYTTIGSIVTGVINPLGLSYSYSDHYVDSLAFQSILNGSAVLIRGNHYNNPDASGHIFLINGYRKYRVCTLYEYFWVYDVDPEENTPIAPSRFEYEYTSGQINKINMHWGLDPAYDLLWFGTGDQWVVGSIYCDRNHRMYYDFHLPNN